MSDVIANTITRLHVVEGSASCYSYHLSVTGKSGQPSLCGSTRVMNTMIPMEMWNKSPTHIRSKFCTKCTEIANAQGFNTPKANPDTLVFVPVPNSSL